MILLGEPFIYQKRFVAVLDILGFSELVNNEPSPQIVSQILKRLQRDALLTCGRYPNQKISGGTLSPKCHPIMMSDTILIYSDDDSVESFRQIVAQSFSLLQDSILNNLGTELKDGQEHFRTDKISQRFYVPMRGAISYGDFFADKELDIYFGPAFLDAQKWEKAQAWMGAILTPECLKYYRNSNISHNLLVEYSKGDFIKSEHLENCPDTLLAIDWTFQWPDYFMLNKTFYENVESPDLQSRYKNTFDFFEYCQRRNQK